MSSRSPGLSVHSGASIQNCYSTSAGGGISCHLPIEGLWALFCGTWRVYDGSFGLLVRVGVILHAVFVGIYEFSLGSKEPHFRYPMSVVAGR